MKLSHESSRETHLEAADDDFDISGEFQKFSAPRRLSTRLQGRLAILTEEIRGICISLNVIFRERVEM